MTAMTLTGMMPSLLASPTISRDVAQLAHNCHMFGVVFGVGAPCISSLCLALVRCERCCHQAKRDPSLPETPCQRFWHGHHDALAAVGYSLILPIVAVAGVVFYKAGKLADNLDKIFDACIVNHDQQSCDMGSSCLWDPLAG